MDILSLMFPLQSSEWLHWNDDVTLDKLHQNLGLSGEFCFIHSENPTKKTALLFQCAVSECTQSGYTILITQEQLQNLPLHVHGMPQPGTAALKNLKILYMKTATEFRHYFSSIHQMTHFPDLIIVENLEHYVKDCSGETGVSSMAKLCALMTDSVKYISQKSGNQCRILASLTNSHVQVIDVCHRYATCSFKLEYDDTCGTGMLHSDKIMPLRECSFETIVICYKELDDCIKLQHISLVKPKLLDD